MLELVDNLLVELGNKVHPKINEKVKNNILYACQLYSSPEMYYENISSLYEDYYEEEEEEEEDNTLVSLGDFIVPDDEYEEEEEIESSSYNPEEEEEGVNDTDDFEELKDNLENNGIFLRGNKIIIKRGNRQKLDELDKKFMDLTQGKQYNLSDLDY